MPPERSPLSRKEHSCILPIRKNPPFGSLCHSSLRDLLIVTTKIRVTDFPVNLIAVRIGNGCPCKVYESILAAFNPYRIRSSDGPYGVG